ncbi:MAG: SCO family protein [Mangrovicoccus sp.]|nr:SCO family protein [Mangrovicoccus sp.]
MSTCCPCVRRGRSATTSGSDPWPRRGGGGTGLTGPLPEIERAAAGFRATFEKMPRDGDYTMNHTAGVFLFRADGRFGGIVDYHEDRRFALPKIRRTLE